MLLFVYTLLSLLFILLISTRKISISLPKIMIIALSLRIIVTLIFSTSQSEDINAFLKDGANLISGDSLYEANYFPFVSYLGALALYLKEFIDPYIFLKIIFAIFDVALIYPLYYLAKKNSQSALIYGLNPISIIVSNIHGQIDSLPLFFLLMGILLYLQKKLFSSILILSLGVYIKTWPVLFVIPLFKKAKNKLLFIFVPIIPLILTFVHSIYFHVSFIEIISKVKNHRGIFGAWGLSKIILYLSGYSLIPAIEQFMRRVFIAAFLIFSFVRDDKNILKTILMIMLFFFSFTPTFGIQWFSWLIPFVLIVRPKLWKMFLVFGSIYLTFGFVWDTDTYFRSIMTIWNSIITRVGFITWIFIVYMFLRNLKTAR